MRNGVCKNSMHSYVFICLVFRGGGALSRFRCGIPRSNLQSVLEKWVACESVQHHATPFLGIVTQSY